MLKIKKKQKIVEGGLHTTEHNKLSDVTFLFPYETRSAHCWVPNLTSECTRWFMSTCTESLSTMHHSVWISSGNPDLWVQQPRCDLHQTRKDVLKQMKHKKLQFLS